MVETGHQNINLTCDLISFTFFFNSRTFSISGLNLFSSTAQWHFSSGWQGQSLAAISSIGFRFDLDRIFIEEPESDKIENLMHTVGILIPD